MTLTLCINVYCWCDEPVSCVFSHLATSILLHCLKPTARLFPLLAGRSPRLPRWLPFPQDPHITPPHGPLQPGCRHRTDILRSLGSPLSLPNWTHCSWGRLLCSSLSVCYPYSYPSLFSWGGGIFVIMKILFFGNCCESLECEEKISKLKNVKSSKLQTPMWPRDISAFRFCRQYVRDCHTQP